MTINDIATPSEQDLGAAIRKAQLFDTTTEQFSSLGDVPNMNCDCYTCQCDGGCDCVCQSNCCDAGPCYGGTAVYNTNK
ncbi:MAG: hypothetical protein H6502_02890 [Candidatus Woesearchaeota archaeon]|nr:MAG: hypothetical protein H6502_02890 [Candidatus Woesearchaeota archaeon]